MALRLSEGLGPTDAKVLLEFISDLVALISCSAHKGVPLFDERLRLLWFILSKFFPLLVQRQEFQGILKDGVEARRQSSREVKLTKFGYFRELPDFFFFDSGSSRRDMGAKSNKAVVNAETIVVQSNFVCSARGQCLPTCIQRGEDRHKRCDDCDGGGGVLHFVWGLTFELSRDRR